MGAYGNREGFLAKGNAIARFAANDHGNIHQHASAPSLSRLRHRDQPFTGLILLTISQSGARGCEKFLAIHAGVTVTTPRGYSGMSDLTSDKTVGYEGREYAIKDKGGSRRAAPAGNTRLDAEPRRAGAWR